MPDTPRVAPLLTPQDVADRLGVHVMTVRKRIAAREWPCTRMGRHVKFTEEQLAQIVRMCEQPVVQARRSRKAG